MDQFGWTEEQTVLRFGILIASISILCVFLFATIGPLSNRFDERKILIFIGIGFMMLGRLFVFPIPGFDPPPLANSNSSAAFRSQFWSSRNIACEEATAAEPGCGLEWCKTMPAVTIPQVFGGIIVGSIGYPFCVAITQSLFSKIIGPRPQVLLF